MGARGRELGEQGGREIGGGREGGFAGRGMVRDEKLRGAGN